MYSASVTRHTLVTVVLVPALAALLATSLYGGSTPTATATAALPQLPEVVVTAQRLPA